jgi:circadian clock protein KaiC
MSESGRAPPIERVPTGITGLDEILGGGLFKAGIYVVVGAPGAGKTILATQVCSRHVAEGGRALYVTLLAETHAQMLAQMQGLSFFDPSQVGTSLKYVNGFSAVEKDGLAGLLALLRTTVREHQASLLILDGMVIAPGMAKSTVDYKKFINELQTWMGFIGCTVLFLTSAGADATIQPEHTMVDGIFELRTTAHQLRSLRQVKVTKFRGSAYMEGAHPYAITGAGVQVHPRVEVRWPPKFMNGQGGPRAQLGISRLDALLHGGLSRHSTTLVLGAPGTGKTALGLHFLASGAAQGERGLHFGFYERAGELVHQAKGLGLDVAGFQQRGLFEVVWQPPAEPVLDALAGELIDAVRRTRAQRLFIDGMAGLKGAPHPERLANVLSVLSQELASQGVTTLISKEARQPLGREVEMPSAGVSAIFHNIFVLRQVESRAELLRLFWILKARESSLAQVLFTFEMTNRGIELGKPFGEADVALTGGTSTPTRTSALGRRSVKTGRKGKR